jgi:hypothetical protein
VVAKFEYLVVEVPERDECAEDVEETQKEMLDDLGSQGWQLVSVVSVPAHYRQCTRFYFVKDKDAKKE